MQGPVLLLLLFLLATPSAPAGDPQEPPGEDVVPTETGDLILTFVGHGTLMLRHAGKVIHVDPVGSEADYRMMPDADLILVTHDHGDHLDPDAIAEIRKEGTEILVAPSCTGRIDGAKVLSNGESAMAAGIEVDAVPAYNLVHERSPGVPYHPRGAGNGYILTFGGVRVYVAGDTENTPEMKALEDIDIAFLPMNLPYTMSPEMVADAARTFRPAILYPYHFGNTDPHLLLQLLEGEGIEVRVRDLS